MSKQTRLSLLVLFVVFILFGIAGQNDYEDAIEQENYYCEMVKIWQHAAARGVRAEDRAGWPPFKEGEVQCPSQ